MILTSENTNNFHNNNDNYYDFNFYNNKNNNCYNSFNFINNSRI